MEVGVEVRVRGLEGAGTMEGQRGSVAYWEWKWRLSCAV